MDILFSVLVLGGLGLVLGILLAIASRVFYVKKNELFQPLCELLPGANCGGCGYAGCSAFACALLEGRADPSACTAGDTDMGLNVASLLGMEPPQEKIRLTAFVKCAGGQHSKNKYIYAGISDCACAMKIGGGPVECTYGCIGLGSCVESCPFNALSIVDNVAVVDHERCTGCLRCVRACPKNIITAIPYYADVNVACSSLDKGGALRKFCGIGCLGCKICEKACRYDAIHVTNNLAVIDYEKCVKCGDCAEKCPRKIILDSNPDCDLRIISGKQ